jgi:hypothetical protein
MKTLFIVGRDDADTCFEIARKTEGKRAILFIQEGGLYAIDLKVINQLDFCKLYALEEDCVTAINKVKLVNFEGWVKLLEEYKIIVSWT